MDNFELFLAYIEQRIHAGVAGRLKNIQEARGFLELPSYDTAAFILASINHVSRGLAVTLAKF